MSTGKRRAGKYRRATTTSPEISGELRTHLLDAHGKAEERAQNAYQRLGLTVEACAKARADYAQGTKTMAELIADEDDSE